MSTKTPKFQVNQKVIIAAGTYRDCQGVIQRVNLKPRNTNSVGYLVRFTHIPLCIEEQDKIGSSIWFREGSLELNETDPDDVFGKLLKERLRARK